MASPTDLLALPTYCVSQLNALFISLQAPDLSIASQNFGEPVSEKEKILTPVMIEDKTETTKQILQSYFQYLKDLNSQLLASPSYYAENGGDAKVSKAELEEIVENTKKLEEILCQQGYRPNPYFIVKINNSAKDITYFLLRLDLERSAAKFNYSLQSQNASWLAGHGKSSREAREALTRESLNEDRATKNLTLPETAVTISKDGAVDSGKTSPQPPVPKKVRPGTSIELTDPTSTTTEITPEDKAREETTKYLEWRSSIKI